MNQKKIVFFTLRKDYAAAFIQGQKAILLTDLKQEDKNYQFFIKPAIEQAQIDTIDFIGLKKDTILTNFILKKKQIVFNNYRVLILDETLNYKKLKIDGTFNSIWLTANTKFNLESLPKEISQNLIIDATNKDYKIAAFKVFAENNKMHPHILKKNPAYLVHLTQ